MKWGREEIEKLSLILKQIEADLEPLDGKSILILCSAAGDVAFWLGEKMKRGQILGLELNDELLEIAKVRAREKGLESIVIFRKAEKSYIPYPDEVFDALVSEFIIFPTSTPTQIGQPEMARVLKTHGKMILTDVITTRHIPREKRILLQTIGLDYLCEATQEDFLKWMRDAGLVNVEILDFTPIVKEVWEQRWKNAATLKQQKAYSILLEDSEIGLGKAIFYIYIRGRKLSSHP